MDWEMAVLTGKIVGLPAHSTAPHRSASTFEEHCSPGCLNLNFNFPEASAEQFQAHLWLYLHSGTKQWKGGGEVLPFEINEG